LNNFFQQLFQQMKEIWARLTRVQRIVLVAVPSALLVAILIFIVMSAGPRYDVLYSRLAQKDASDIVAELAKTNVPYKIANNGDVILVPTGVVNETRLKLAGMGLPRGGGVGFEIFDATKFGMTDFTQKVNYKRALEGELQRTISSLSEIESCRVHIVMPEPELFTEKEKPTTASVVLELKPDTQIKRDQVRGIVNLVASGVEGLKPENVNVVDSHGNILSAFIAEEAAESSPEALANGAGVLTQQAKLTLHQMEIQRNFEKDLEKKISSVLTKALPNNRFSVAATAELNFDKTENQSETFEPVVDGQGIVRSSQTKKEQYVGDGGFPANVVGGVPGTDSNIPGYQAVAGNNAQFSREEAITNYEINRTVRHNVEAPGAPKRVSVAVFVDDLQPQQVSSIRTIVMAAAGLDLNRGDQVAVENMPFDKSQDLARQLEGEKMNNQMFAFTLAKIGLLLLVGIGVLLFLRSILGPKKVKDYVEAPEDIEIPEERPIIPQVEDLISPEVTADELARMEAAREAKKRENLRREVADLARQHPENVAQIIKKWLSEE
jgi:flagellar M-ring protein FliF